MLCLQICAWQDDNLKGDKTPFRLSSLFFVIMTQNLHIEHPEDTILTGVLSCLDCLLNPGHLSVKIDGAPAIVWGTNPANGKFFVGTKSVFNKVKIKINHSHAEIDQNHVGEVATILHHCFDCLPDTDGIFQGDFIGFGGSDEYTPNTITYKFPTVIDQNIIVAPHTYYTFTEFQLKNAKELHEIHGNVLGFAVAHPMNFTITDTIYCKFVKPKARIFSGDYDTSLRSFSDLSEVIQFAKVMAQNVTFVDEKKAKQIKQELNKCIREGVEIDDNAFDCDYTLIAYWKLIKSIKDDALYLCRNDGPAAYIGHDRIDAEGYVFSNEFGTMKLVNRKQFSYANFNNNKFAQTP